MELLRSAIVATIVFHISAVYGAPISLQQASYEGDNLVIAFGKTEAGKRAEFILNFLLKYDYIEQHTADGILPLMETTLDEVCVKDAVRCMQKVAGISETGVVDDTTLDLMQTPRCGVRDADICKSRRKRFATTRYIWTHTNITWRMTNYTHQLPLELLNNETTQAFKLWADVSPLTFTEADHNSDIEMFFGVREHGDDSPFDGPQGVLAHAFYPGYSHPLQGDIHFDNDERWITIPEVMGFHYFHVVLHEIGHSLGLNHSADFKAIMYPYYNASNRELAEDDINGIHQLYYGNVTGKNAGLDQKTTGFSLVSIVCLLLAKMALFG